MQALAVELDALQNLLYADKRYRGDIAARKLLIATLLREILRNLDLRYPPGDPALAHFTIE